MKPESHFDRQIQRHKAEQYMMDKRIQCHQPLPERLWCPCRICYWLLIIWAQVDKKLLGDCSYRRPGTRPKASRHRKTERFYASALRCCWDSIYFGTHSQPLAYNMRKKIKSVKCPTNLPELEAGAPTYIFTFLLMLVWRAQLSLTVGQSVWTNRNPNLPKPKVPVLNR